MHGQVLLQVRLSLHFIYLVGANSESHRWPAIVGIVIGSLILLSILFCLVQCLCCGVSCAKMLCCCCRGCGRSSRSKEKPSRYRDEYQHMPPTPYSGYQPAPANPMSYRGAPAAATATFDMPPNRRINEDSLPPMPSWDTAATRRVEESSIPEKAHYGDDVEMGRLPPLATGRNGYNQVPNGPISPTSPTYGQNGYFAGHPNQHQSSDLGAQRMGPYNDQDVPHSPAPTYTTNAPATDRFAAGALAAAPYSYQNQRDNYSQAGDSYAPSSTQYERSSFHQPHAYTQPLPSPYQSHSVSPPPQQYQNPAMSGGRPPSFGHSGSVSPYAPSPYDGHRSISPPSQEQVGGRPPSLLQIGRKAVPGSQREI